MKGSPRNLSGVRSNHAVMFMHLTGQALRQESLLLHIHQLVTDYWSSECLWRCLGRGVACLAHEDSRWVW